MNPFHPKPTGGDQFGNDPLSAPTFMSSRSRQKLPSQSMPEESVELPLEAWSFGVKMHDTGLPTFFFVWSAKKCTVSVRRRSDHGPTTGMMEIKTSQIADMKVCVFCSCTNSSKISC